MELKWPSSYIPNRIIINQLMKKIMNGLEVNNKNHGKNTKKIKKTKFLKKNRNIFKSRSNKEI